MGEETVETVETEEVKPPEIPGTGDNDTPPPGDDALPEDQKVPLKALQEERRKRQEAEERNQRFERIFDEKLKQEPEKPKAPEVPPNFPAKPQVDQFATYDEYVEAVTDWKTDLKFAQRDMQQQVTAQKTEQQKTYEAHGTRIQEAKGKYADFDAVIETTKDIAVRPDIIGAIVESDVSADLIYHLAKNPKEVERLNTLPERAMLRELGKIEAKLSVPAPRKPSSAPPPITPVSGIGGSPIGEPSNIDDWQRKERERCMRERGRPY